MRGQAPLSCPKPPPPLSTTGYISPTASQDKGWNSADNTPTSSVHLSPTVNLSREYYLAVQTSSYSEIRSKFYQSLSIGRVDFYEEPQLLEHVLRPSHECVQEALSHINPNSLTHLASTYFDHSENSSRLYLLLYLKIREARLLYTPMHNLLNDLPIDDNSDYHTLSSSQCDLAFNIFLEFDSIENPFLSIKSHSFNNMRQGLTELSEDLNHHVKKSESKLHLIRHCSRGCAICVIAAAVGIVISAVTIATHALVALVAVPVCTPILPSSVTKREKMHLAQLDAAAKGAYVLRNDLDTVDRLVARLHAAVENDRLLIHLGIERGRDKYGIQEILKQLRRNRPNFVQQLADLEEHLFLCFAAINRARLLLLQEIRVHQNPA